jgi:acyl-CoA synthetase (AMP-forming)/AMP-acid ligase II
MSDVEIEGVTRPALDYAATVPGLISHVLNRFPASECVVTVDESVTFAEIEDRSRRLARRLVDWGVGKGTRVGTHFPYGVEWLVSWLAITRIGGIHFPFSTAYKPAELRKSLRFGDVALLLSPASLFGHDHRAFVAEAVQAVLEDRQTPPHTDLPHLRDIWFGVEGDQSTGLDSSVDAMGQQVTAADQAVAIFTSGTTSEPKGVLHTHGALIRKGAHLARLQRLNAKDRVFCGMPFFWVGGIGMTVVPAFDAGATLLCLDRTDPARSLHLMRRERATKMTGWPGVLGPIKAAATDADWETVAALKAPLSLVGARHSSLGMTETLAPYTYSTPEQQSIPLPAGRTGSMGWVIDGADVRIVDLDSGQPLPDDHEGAIEVRGYFMMAGMVKREREDVFTRDGFYNTGDKGYLLGDQLFLTGRLSEMIKTSGNNVAPPEVEAVMRSLPEIQDAYVLGIPDSERGEAVAALVVPSPGASVRAESIRERCRLVLSNFKVPRLVVVAEEQEVPWLATGKPDRLRIKAMLLEAASA